MSIDARARDAAATARSSVTDVPVPDPSRLVARRRRRTRRGFVIAAVVLGVIAVGIRLVTNSRESTVAVDTPVRRATRGGAVDNRYVPQTTTRDGVVTMPITLPDGRPYTVRYAQGLGLAQLGFLPATHVQWLVQDKDTLGRTLSISYGTIADRLAGAMPVATYPGVDGQPVRYYRSDEIDGLVFQFGPWLVQVPDRADPTNHPDERMDVGQLTTWAKSLHGRVDAQGFPVLTADAPLLLTQDTKTSFVLGPAQTSLNNIAIGEHWLCTGPDADSTTPRHFPPTPKGAATGAAWCDRHSGLHVSVVGSRRFVRDVIATFRIEPFSSQRLAARILLPARTLEAGSQMTGQVIVVNNTGKTLTYSGCGGLFAVALHNDSYEPAPPQLSCLMQIDLPEGETAYPVGVIGTHYTCSDPSGCPLPPGNYEAELIPFVGDFPDATPIPVRVTAP